MHAISRAASIALWAFMGIESASVSAGVIDNPKRNIPLATLSGLAISAVVYLLKLHRHHGNYSECAVAGLPCAFRGGCSDGRRYNRYGDHWPVCDP